MEQLSREKGDTWPQVLKYNCEKYGDRHRAMRHKHYGVWQPVTWKDYYDNVKYLSLGLLTLGMAPGDKVLIIGDNAPQWYYAELAAQANRGAAVGMFSDSSPEEIKFTAENSGARFAVIEGQEQADKFLQIADALPRLQKIVCWSYKGLAKYDQDIWVGWREVLQLGQTYENEHPGDFERNLEAGRPDDVCAIIYTAGTTDAAPKGAVHSHRTLRAGAEFLLHLDPWTEEDNVAPYLPPVWIHEQWIGIGCHLLSGATLNFAEAPETQLRDCRETGPSIVFNRARIWESQAATVHARVLEADAVKRWAYRRLLPIGVQAAESRYRGQALSPFRKWRSAFADVLLFRSIRRSLGLANARICYTSGAILSPDALRFYHALNLPLKSLYGSTEGGALTGARDAEVHSETVGPAGPDAKLKIGAAGELIYRQPSAFLGYHNDPEKTAAVFKDGWFHSGDGGILRDDGQIVFVDRVRDLLELAGGRKLSPQLTESRLRFSPYIKDAWVLAGPEAVTPTAVIVIDGDSVGRWAGQRKVAFSSFAELSQSPEAYALVRRDIDRVNQDLPAGMRVGKFVNLHKEFDPDESELTRTRNLRRTVLFERYRTLIEAVHAGKTRIEIEAQVSHRDGRMSTIPTTLRIESLEGASG